MRTPFIDAFNKFYPLSNFYLSFILLIFTVFGKSMNIHAVRANLNNKYEFNLACVQKSIKIFDIALETGHCPSRVSVVINLAAEIACCPFYLIAKVVSIAEHLFSFLLLNSPRVPLTIKHLSHLFLLSSLQFFLPLICTIIRIAASILGLATTRWALRGWRLAEKGEELSHQMIAHHWQASIQSNSSLNREEDIRPTSALFYLGWNKAHEIAHSPALLIDRSMLEQDIRAKFLTFLQNILDADEACFQKMFIKEQANDGHTHFCEEHIFDPPLFSLLTKLEEIAKAPRLQGTSYEQELIRSSASELALEEMQQLFYYVSFNLQQGFLERRLHNLNQPVLLDQINYLTYLFSARLKFGRVNYFS